MSKFRMYPVQRSFTNLFEDFFNRSLSDFIGADLTVNQPSVNIIEENDRFKIELAAPGLEKNDFNLKLENGFLTISAEKEESKEDKDEKEGRKYTRREFNYNYFSRSFQMPETADVNKISATYSNGVLIVDIMKKEEAKASEPKLIEIK